MQANCSILPDGLCTHSHIPTLPRVYSHGHSELPKRVSAQMVGLWKVPGRKSEAESQDLPTPPSPAHLRSPSKFHQHDSRLPVPWPCPLPTSWDSSEIWVPGDPGGLTCRVRGPLTQTQPWKWKICCRKLGLILSPSGSLAPHTVWTLWFPWTGGRVGIMCPPAVPSLLCTTGQGREAQRRWKACLQLWVPSCPCPRPVQMRRLWGPRGQTGCGPRGAATTPQGSHGHGLTTGCGLSMDLALMSPGRAQEASQPRHEVSALSLSAWSNPLLQRVGPRFSFWISPGQFGTK